MWAKRGEHSFVLVDGGDLKEDYLDGSLMKSIKASGVIVNISQLVRWAVSAPTFTSNISSRLWVQRLSRDLYDVWRPLMRKYKLKRGGD